MKKLTKLKQRLATPQSIASGTVSIIIFTILSKALGFIREMVLASKFGTSWRMDALIIAMDPAIRLGGIISGAVAAMIVPVYLKLKNEDNEENIKAYTTQILFFSSVLLITFGIFLTLFPEFFINVFAPSFEAREKAYAIRKMRITGILPLVNGLSSLVASFLQADKKYMLASSIQLVYNVIAIPLLLLTAPFFSEASYLFATVVGMGTMGMVYLYIIRKSIKIKFIRLKMDSLVRETFKLALPLMITSGVSVINTIVDKAFASSLPSGSITALRIAQSVNGMITTIIIGSLMTTIFTELSTTAAENDMHALGTRLKKTSKDLLNLLIPLACAIVLLADPIIQILFQRGNFDQNSTDLVSATFIGYSVLLVASPIKTLIVKTFTAFKKTYITFVVSTASVVLNYLMNSLFIERYGVMGIAISTSVVSVINMLALYLIQLKVFGINFIDFRNFSKTSLLSLGAFFFFYYLRDIICYDLWLGLSVFAFASVLIFLNKEIAKRILNKAKALFKRKR